VILLAVRWYLRYGLSYRDVEELLAERGLDVDHVTIYRWVQRFTPLLIDAARPCRHTVGDRWFVDETYVKVTGVWRYVYRSVDQHRLTADTERLADRRPRRPGVSGSCNLIPPKFVKLRLRARHLTERVKRLNRKRISSNQTHRRHGTLTHDNRQRWRHAWMVVVRGRRSLLRRESMATTGSNNSTGDVGPLSSNPRRTKLVLLPPGRGATEVS